MLCLNPRHVTGKLDVLTDWGRQVVAKAFKETRPEVSRDVDWRRYAQVVRAKVRKLMLLELAKRPETMPKTATAIRKSLRDKHPVGLNPTIRALKDLERLGLVRQTAVGDRETRRTYTITKAGVATAQQLLK